jgi:ABC-type nitrate/sulfonate/bicarbonate transport system substrate-binding protein
MRDASLSTFARCALLAATTVGFLGMAFGAPALAAEKVTVGKGGQNVFSFSLLDVGIRQGIFAKHGLEVVSSEFNGGSRMQQALAADSIDFGVGGGTDLAAISKGAPVKAVAAMGGPPLDFAIAVRADGPIHTVDQLKGVKIGVTTLSSLTAWLTGELSRTLGWGTDGIVRVPVGSASASVALLRTKAIDGFTSGLDNAMRAEARGQARVVVRYGDYIKNFHTFLIYARNKVIEQRPQAVRAFLAGWFDTIAYVRSHKAETVKIASQVLAQDPKIAAKLYDQLTPGYSSDGKFVPASMKGLARALNDQYHVPESAIAGLYTEEFLPKR